MSLGDFQVTVDSGWRVGKSHGEDSERVFYASKFSKNVLFPTYCTKVENVLLARVCTFVR